MFECFDAVRVERQGLARERHARGDVVRRVTGLRLAKELARLVDRVAQRLPSISPSASFSVKTRNEFVRTFPWPLTASATRVIVSSSGASAMTT